MKRIFFLIMSLTMVLSCKEDPIKPEEGNVEEEKPVITANSLKVEPRSFASADPGTIVTLTVETDVDDWDVDMGDCDWLEIKSKNGKELELEYSGGISLTEDRDARIVFSAGGLSYPCTLTYKKALMLDVEFQEDGSAIDKSPYNRTIQKIGSNNLLTWHSSETGLNVARFGHSPGSNITSGYYKIDYSSDRTFQDALADGYSIETYLMYDAAPAGASEVKVFTSTEQGGMGIMIANSSYSNQLCHIAHNGKEWVFTCGGVTPQRGKYYHVVAVYDQKNNFSSIYVNGKKTGSKAFNGELKFPSARGYYWFGLGADPGSTPQAAWKGDVAYARIYDAALTDKDVASLYENRGGDISDLSIRIDGLCLLSPCTTGSGRPFYIAGTGFKDGDIAKVKDSSTGAIIGAYNLIIEQNRASFAIPEGFQSGTYELILEREGEVYPLGTSDITISNDIPEGWKPKVIAHRGFHKKESENSIGSLRAAQELGAWGSETDLYITADDSLMMNHDGTIGGYKIDQSTYAQVRSCKLGNGEPVPTFREYLLQAKKYPQTKLIIEIKDHSTQARENAATDAMLAMIRNLGMDDQVEYIAFDRETCKRVALARPEAMVGYLSGNVSPTELYADGIMSIDYNYGVLFNTKPAWITEAHDLGMVVNIWTVNSDTDLMKAIGLGCDCITTDNPDRLIELIDIFL